MARSQSWRKMDGQALLSLTLLTSQFKKLKLRGLPCELRVLKPLTTANGLQVVTLIRVVDWIQKKVAVPKQAVAGIQLYPTAWVRFTLTTRESAWKSRNQTICCLTAMKFITARLLECIATSVIMWPCQTTTSSVLAGGLMAPQVASFSQTPLALALTQWVEMLSMQIETFFPFSLLKSRPTVVPTLKIMACGIKTKLWTAVVWFWPEIQHMRGLLS